MSIMGLGPLEAANDEMFQRIIKERDMIDAVTVAIIAHISGMAVGEASMCWSDYSKAGTFDSMAAQKVTLELVDKIMVELKRVRVQALTEYLELGPEEVKKLLDVMTTNRSEQ